MMSHSRIKKPFDNRLNDGPSTMVRNINGDIIMHVIFLLRHIIRIRTILISVSTCGSSSTTKGSTTTE